MWHHFASSDRLSSHRSESRSPYAKNYRTNLTHDQREQLSHRQNISKIPRQEFEDRYIALLDEYYALKKENAANNQKIKKMATKLLRLSAEGKSRGMPFPQQLAPNENLEIQIVRLEAYNSLLKDRINAIIKKYSSCVQSTTTSTMRRPASCSNLSIKRKMILNEDDLHLFEIPEPPTIVSKNDNRSSIGSGSAITTEPKASTMQTASNKSQNPYQQSQSSVIFENDNLSNVDLSVQVASNEEKSYINNLKNMIQKLQTELNEVRGANESLRRLNCGLEDQLISKRSAENVELVELRRTMLECEIELHELREQYLTLKAKAENDLNVEHKKIDELTQIVKKEMDRNSSLSRDLQAIRSATNTIESLQTGKLQEKLIETAEVHDNNEQISTKTEDLTDLLNEAKATILQLQDKTQSLKNEIEMLRQQNHDYSKRIEQLLDCNNESVSVSNDVHPPPIPLEPIVIVKENRDEKDTKCSQIVNAKTEKHDVVANINYEKDCSEQSTSSSRSSQLEKTFVGTNDKLQETKKYKKHKLRLLQHSSTNSEISSLDSEENFRIFQSKNKEIQDSMMLFESHRTSSKSFSKRLNLLERYAYYRPLANIVSTSNDMNNHRILSCDCTGFECDQQNEIFYDEIRRAVKNARSIMLQELQSNPQGVNDQGIGSTFGNFFDDSSECREFLRVQYNLNNLYKQELEIICKVCKKQRQDLIKQIDNLKSKLQMYEEKLQEKLQEKQLNNGELPMTESVKMVHVDCDEGSFEFHVTAFRPTKEGRSLLSCRHGELTSLFASWKFYECEFDSKTSIRPPPNYAYDSSHIYVVSINKQFLAQLQNEKMTINLFASTGSTSTLMGVGEISLSEVLIFPQNKIQLITKVISVSSECEHMNAFEQYCSCDVTMAKPKHLGNLTLWFRLTCELDVLKHYINNIEQWWAQSEKPDNAILPSDRAAGQNVLMANKGHQKTNPTELIEYGWSANNSADQTNHDKTLVTVTILSLKLNDTIFEVSSKTMESIHIECNFLGIRRFKTNLMPLKTNELSFHFMHKFPHNDQNMQRLMNILDDSEHSIKLVLVKTRQVADGNEVNNESTEVGFGLLHLAKFIQEWNGTNGSGLHTFEIPILSKKPPYQNIGCLIISIEDIQSLKQLQQKFQEKVF